MTLHVGAFGRISRWYRFDDRVFAPDRLAGQNAGSMAGGWYRLGTVD